jgi:predicted dehydrogenase
MNPIKPPPVRLGLVGAGYIAREHLQVLRAMPDVQLAGIASRTRAKAETLAAEFGIASVAPDAATLLEQVRPDGVLVLVSADQVAAVAREVLPRAGAVFLEKPVGFSSAETLALADLAARHGTRTMVGYNRRYYSIFAEGLRLVKERGPLLGVLVEGHERMARVRAAAAHSAAILDGWLYANATHTIDLLRLFGGEVADLATMAAASREPLGDQFSASLRFRDGAIGTYVAHWLSPGGWRAVLYGDGITVEFKPLEEGRWTGPDFVTHALAPAEDDRAFKPGFFRQMRAFVDLVRGHPLSWPGEDLAGAARTMALADQLARAAGAAQAGRGS